MAAIATKGVWLCQLSDIYAPYLKLCVTIKLWHLAALLVHHCLGTNLTGCLWNQFYRLAKGDERCGITTKTGNLGMSDAVKRFTLDVLCDNITS